MPRLFVMLFVFLFSVAFCDIIEDEGVDLTEAFEEYLAWNTTYATSGI